MCLKISFFIIFFSLKLHETNFKDQLGNIFKPKVQYYRKQF